MTATTVKLDLEAEKRLIQAQLAKNIAEEAELKKTVSEEDEMKKTIVKKQQHANHPRRTYATNNGNNGAGDVVSVGGMKISPLGRQMMANGEARSQINNVGIECSPHVLGLAQMALQNGQTFVITKTVEQIRIGC